MACSVMSGEMVENMTASLYGSRPVVSGERGEVRGGIDQGREEEKGRRIQRGVGRWE